MAAAASSDVQREAAALAESDVDRDRAGAAVIDVDRDTVALDDRVISGREIPRGSGAAGGEGGAGGAGGGRYMASQFARRRPSRAA